MIVLIILFTVCVALLICFAGIRNFRRKIVKHLMNDKYYNLMVKLYGKDRAYDEEEKYLSEKIRLCLSIITAGMFMATLIAITAYSNPVFDENYRIKREGYEGIDKTVSLWVDKEGKDRESITVNISHQIYKPEELNRMSEEIIGNIDTYILNGNSSTDNVMYDLNLIKSIEEYPFDISWKCDKPLILGRDGYIDYERLKKQLADNNSLYVDVILSMLMTYEEYKTETEIPIRMRMPEKTQEEIFSEALRIAIEKEDKDSIEKEYYKLPEYIDGTRVFYSQQESKSYLLLLILIVAATITVYSAKDNELNKMIKEKYDEMESDYPKIVNQYALYYCAGMHTKSIWHEICQNYREEIARGGKKRNVYEEMLTQDNRMSEGVGELKAYNDFSDSIKLQSYRGFISIIEQALIKGKDNVIPILNKEADNAQKERMNRARILGEKAGTKMLIPMFMMLGVVLLIVIIPAFISFQI